MTEIIKRGPKKIQANHGMPDYYKFHKEKYGVKVSKKDFNAIITHFNNGIIDLILNHAQEYKIPLLGFILQIRKQERKPFIDEDGILQIKAPIDWVTTRKLWDADEEAYKTRHKIRYMNYHTNGHVFKVHMDKGRNSVKNKSAYKFKVSRLFQRALGKRILDKNKEKFDCHLYRRIKDKH